MKHILRKLHIGGNHDGSRSHEVGASSSSPSQSCATDHRTLSGSSWTNVTSPSLSPGRDGSNEVPNRAGRANGEEEQCMDYYLFEEEYQVQLALAISASNTEVTDDPESLQIKAAQRLSLGHPPSPARNTDTTAESLARRYWDYNVLDYEEKVMDGFYDVYGSLSDPSFQGTMPSLVELQQIPVSYNLGYEVVLVNRAIDAKLEQLEQVAICYALESGAAELGPVTSGVLQRIADLVAGHMGGPVTDANDMLTRWTITSYELQMSLNNIVLPLGCLQLGLSRHRALLFKVLADHVGIPCRLVKGSHYTGIDEGAINIIKLDHEREFIIDLMGAPGTLIPAEISSTISTQDAEMDSLSLSQHIPEQMAPDLCLVLHDKDNGQSVDRSPPQKNPSSEPQFQDVLLNSSIVPPSGLFVDANPYQIVGEKKIVQQNRFPERRLNEFHRRQENISSGNGRPPFPNLRKNPFICNDVSVDKSRMDFVEGMGPKRLPEARAFNIPPVPARPASEAPHISISGISAVTSSRDSSLPSSSGSFALNGIHKGLPASATAANRDTASAVASSIVAAAGKCSVSTIDVPMPVATNTFASPQKQTEVDNVFRLDLVDREGPHNAERIIEFKEYEKKNYDKLEKQQGTRERLVDARRASENEQDPNHSRNVHPRRLDPVLDDVAEWEIPWEDLVIGERIGLGSYGEVYHADWNGKEVAVKKFLDQDFSGDALEEFRSEVRIMRRLRHPNVVLFMGAVTRPPNLSIVTEFLPRGSLYRLIHRPNIQIDEKRRIRMALDVAKGMNCLHSSTPTIVHRDLKSPNLLVDKNWAVKVCDFGLSRMKHNTFLSSKSTAGTPEWMAPEVLRNEPSNEKCDVYSFGVILWELATLRMPWSGMNPMQVVGAVGFQNRRLDIPKEIDPMVARIIWECWQNDPSLRPSFSQLMAALKPLQRLVISTPSDLQYPVQLQGQTVNARHKS
eukprot:Gb_34740 [translate_table: standard]